MGSAGDSEYLEYVEARGPSLAQLAYVLAGGDRNLADDLVQETLLKAYRHWDRVHAATSPHAYVRRMLVNQLLTWRRRASSAEVPLAAVPDTAVTDPVEDARAGELWPAIARLPPRQRAVLVLRYYEDLSDAQIAQVLGYRAGSVRVIAGRALDELRRVIDRAREGTPT